MSRQPYALPFRHLVFQTPDGGRWWDAAAVELRDGEPQAKQATLTGGVLTDYAYARKILERRAQDVINLDRAAQGLSPLHTPQLLSELDSKKLELDLLLGMLQDRVEVGAINELLLSSFTKVPRLLISILPSLTGNDVVALHNRFYESFLRYLADASVSAWPGDPQSQPSGEAVRKINSFVQNIMTFLVRYAPFADLDERVIRSL